MEIEVKFKVDDFEPLRKKLKELGARFLYSREEKDIYLEPFSELEVFRLRVTGDKAYLTYKKKISDENELNNLELEANVDPGVVEILKAVGHKPVFEKEKKRELWKLGKIGVNLDQVKDLGRFVELELVSDKNRGELQEVAEKLGLDWSKRIRKSYTRMLLEKKGLE